MAEVAEAPQPPAAGTKLIQGLKARNEDTLANVPELYTTPTSGSYHLYSVFDGHGGGDVSEYCATNFHGHLLEQLEEQASSRQPTDAAAGPSGCLHHQERQVLESALTGAFAATDARVAATVSNSASCGSTACVAVVTDAAVVVANCGDSRAVMVRGGQVISLSHDHRPNRQDEVDRVLGCGGQILWNSGARVMGILACTRSVGDRDLQPHGISAVPEIHYFPRTEADEFMIIATDGVWNVLENDVVCGMIGRCLKRAADKNATRASAFRMAADVAGRMAKDKGSRDDIAVVVVDLAPQAPWRPPPCGCPSPAAPVPIAAVAPAGAPEREGRTSSSSSSSNGGPMAAAAEAAAAATAATLAPPISPGGAGFLLPHAALPPGVSAPVIATQANGAGATAPPAAAAAAPIATWPFPSPSAPIATWPFPAPPEPSPTPAAAAAPSSPPLPQPKAPLAATTSQPLPATDAAYAATHGSFRTGGLGPPQLLALPADQQQRLVPPAVSPSVTTSPRATLPAAAASATLSPSGTPHRTPSNSSLGGGGGSGGGAPPHRLALHFALQTLGDAAAAHTTLLRTRSLAGAAGPPSSGDLSGEGGSGASLAGPIRHVSCGAEILVALNDLSAVTC